MKILRPSYKQVHKTLRAEWNDLTEDEQEYFQQLAWDNELKGIEIVFKYNNQIVEVI